VSAAPRVILLLRATRGFDRRLLAGVARYASLHGPWTFYREPHGYLTTRHSLPLQELRAWQPDGAICPVPRLPHLARLGVPVVAYDVNEYTGPVPAVLSEDAEAGRLAAEHLLELGHRHFGFCGYDRMRWSRLRCEAFCRTIEQAGYRVDVYRQPRRGLTTWAREEPYVRRWIQSLPKPVGVLCANDDRAASVLEVCRALGCGVPEDVSIIGVDDDQYVCDLVNPPLSSVKMASDRAGYEAAALLDRMMRGEEQMAGQRIIAPAAGITQRQSTNMLMVRDPELRKALRFIRENAGRPVSVADVVKATGLSHRALNERFRRECGGSILRHLTRARVAHICRLLLETDLRIHEIAAMSGFEDDRHFARYFKRATGLTPQAYRRKHAPP